MFQFEERLEGVLEVEMVNTLVRELNSAGVGRTLCK